MGCDYPLDGWRSRVVNKSGKRSLTWDVNEAFTDMPVTIACGKCIGCRLDYARNWAIRCYHEAQMWEHNCFITLTYDDDHLPVSHSLELDHFQKFMKRLRKMFSDSKVCPINAKAWSPRIRFFHCGEYGARNSRPHYHACIFNFDFPDRVFWREKNGVKLFRSPLLEKLWTVPKDDPLMLHKAGESYGFSSVGDVTLESAGYVARYITKKIYGDSAESHYQGVNAFGEPVKLRPEYVTMSRRDGIGKDWVEKFGSSDVFPHDRVIIDGKKMKPPRFYDRFFEHVYPSDYQKMKAERKRKADLYREKQPLEDSTSRRYTKVQVRGYCLNKLTREYEDAC